MSDKASRDAVAASVYAVMLNGLAMTVAGPDAIMQEGERQMIEPPLARILAKMDEKTRAQVEQYSDPLMLCFGLAAWGSRIYRMEQDKRQQAQAQEPESAPAPMYAPAVPVVEFSAPQSTDIGASSPPPEISALVGSNGAMEVAR